MIKIFIKLKTLKNNESEVQQILSSLVQKFVNEKGCTSVDFNNKNDDHRVFDFLSEWESIEDLNGHLKGKYFSVLLGALKVLCEKPDIKINSDKEIFGMDYIQRIRDQQ